MNVLEEICTFNEIAGFEQKWREFDDKDVLMQMSLIDEEYEELSEAFNNNDVEETLDALCDLIVVVAGGMHRLGVDPEEAMEVVINSNNSKFCYTPEDARESVEMYQEDERYTDVHSQYIGGRYVIFGRKNGGESFKILKGKNFKTPDFKTLVRSAQQKR